MKHFHLIAAAALATCALASCASLPTSLITNIVQQTPTQVTTYAEAEQGATIATNAADALIKAGATTHAQRVQIVALSKAVHSAIVALRVDRDAGKPLVFVTVNAALKAFHDFTGK